jgi:hypothetical protein
MAESLAMPRYHFTARVRVRFADSGGLDETYHVRLFRIWSGSGRSARIGTVTAYVTYLC